MSGVLEEEDIATFFERSLDSEEKAQVRKVLRVHKSIDKGVGDNDGRSYSRFHGKGYC